MTPENIENTIANVKTNDNILFDLLIPLLIDKPPEIIMFAANYFILLQYINIYRHFYSMAEYLKSLKLYHSCQFILIICNPTLILKGYFKNTHRICG